MSFDQALEGWHDFYVATAGAAAALLGLLFVGVSINIGRLDLPQRLDIRGRANQAFINLTFVLVLSLTALIPEQGARSIAVTCGILTALGLFGPGRRLYVLGSEWQGTGRRLRAVRHLIWTLLAIVLLGVATYQFWVSGSEGTLYNLIAVIFLLLLGAADVSWDLLIAVGEDEAADSAAREPTVPGPEVPPDPRRRRQPRAPIEGAATREGASNRSLRVNASGVGPRRESVLSRRSASSSVGFLSTGIHQRTRLGRSSGSNHERRARYSSTWPLWYVNSNRSSIVRHNVRLTMIRGSSKTLIEVASPCSSWSRQRNPGEDSASALISARRSTKPAMIGSAIGARARAT